MIIDIHGRPLDRHTLEERQTAQLGNLRRTFAGHPSRGLTPARLAQILERAERGDMTAQHELFVDMEEKNAHLYAEMGKRRRAPITLDWSIVPPRNATKKEEADAAFAEEVLRDFADLDDLMLDALDAIGHGYSCLELEYDMVDGYRLPVAAHHVPQSWFRTNPDDPDALRLRDNSLRGQALQPFGWIVHRHKARSGYLARSGLGRVLSWPYLFLSYSARDLAEFLEICGLPLRLGKYPEGAQDDEKATLMRAVMGIGHAAAGIIPQGMEIEFHEAAKGAADPYMAMIDWAERSISKAILGQTTSSDARATGLGSGVADLHREVRRDIKLSDCKQLSGALTRDLVYPIIALNRGPRSPRRLARFVFDTGEAADLKLLAEALPGLVDIGLEADVDWLHGKTRIPRAEAGKPLLRRTPGASALSRHGDLAPSRHGDLAPSRHGDPALAALKNQPDNLAQDPLEQLADDLAGGWERVTTPLLDPIERLVADCADLAEFRTRLPGVIARMDAGPLAETLAQGGFAAEVWGRVAGAGDDAGP